MDNVPPLKLPVVALRLSLSTIILQLVSRTRKHPRITTLLTAQALPGTASGDHKTIRLNENDEHSRNTQLALQCLDFQP